MIRKFQVIKSVGRFYNYTARGDRLDLGGRAVIFGHNGYGKSTLTAILRSFGERKPDLLAGRMTLGHSGRRQEIVLSTNIGHFVFNGSEWSPEFPNDWRLMIFDRNFVEDNLFTTEVSSDHKKRIYSIILGDAGRRMATDLSSALEERKRLAGVSASLSKQKEAKDSAIGGLNYLDLPNSITEQHIREEIALLQAQIRAKRTEASMRVRPRFSFREFRRPAIEVWRVALDTNLGEHHKAAKDLLATHFQSHVTDEKEGRLFVEHGLRIMRGDQCPFCGQKLHPAEKLLEAYRTYFDAAYEAAVNRVKSTIDAINLWNPSAETNEFLAYIESMRAIAITWSDAVEINSMPPIEVIVEDCRKLESMKPRLVGLGESKRQALGLSVDLSVFDEIASTCSNIEANASILRSWLSEANEQVESFVRALASEDLSALEKKLKVMESKLQRFSPEEREFCTRYKAASEQLAVAEQNVREMEQQLSSMMRAVFSAHQGRMNEVLEQIGANFRVAELVPQVDRRSTDGRASFAITIQNVNTPVSGGNESQPNFRNTLSEGDRNSLSFAFFIACVDGVGELSQTILLFDDPVSSLDRHRKCHVADIIKDYATRAAQTIVLTHDDEFLGRLQRGWHNDITYLSVHSDGENGSQIEAMDIIEFMKSEKRKRIEALRRYLESDDASVETRRGDIRLVLEDALREKYFVELEQRGSPTTLGAMINALTDELGPVLAEELLELNECCSDAHHARVDRFRDTNYTRDAILPYIQRTLTALKRI